MLKSARKTAEDKHSQLRASLEAHHAEISASSLSDAEMEAVTEKEAQKLVDSEIQEIDHQINDIIIDVFNL